MKELLLFGIFIFLISCNNGKKRDNYQATTDCSIQLSNSSAPGDLSLKITKVIALETGKNFNIGSLDKLFLYESKIIILDNKKTKSVFWFTENGRFIKKTHAVGRGVGEYLGIRDFILYQDGSFLIYDKHLKKFLNFNSQGKYKTEKKVERRINSLLPLPNGGYIVERASDGDFFIERWDDEFNLIEEILKRPEYLKHYGINAEFTLKKNPLNGKISYYPPFSNAIFTLKGNDLNRSFCFRDIDLFPNESFFNQNTGKHPGLLIKELQKSGYITFLDFIENSDMLILKYFKKEEKILTIFDKNTEKTVSFNVKDIGLGDLIFNSLSVSPENEFIGYLFPFELDNRSKYDDLFDHLSSSDNLKENDNPLVVSFNVEINK